jgi:hypothetical protein
MLFPLPTARALAVAAAAITLTLLPVPAQAAPAPQISLVVPDIAAGPASPSAPWTYLGMQTSPDWWGRLHDTTLQIDATDLAGIATVFVPSIRSDGSIEPDDHQCHRQGAVTTCDLGTRAPTSWFPLPLIVVHSAPGAVVGRSGTLRITVTGTSEPSTTRPGGPVGPLVATPTVTVTGS